MASTNHKRQSKRFYFLQFGHFDTVPDKINNASYQVGTEVYDLGDPKILCMTPKQLKRAMSRLLKQYEKMLKEEG